MLPNIALGYNLAKHASLPAAPFELMFGGTGRFIVEEASLPTLPYRPKPEQYHQYTRTLLDAVKQAVEDTRQKARQESA